MWQAPLGWRASWVGATADAHYTNLQTGLETEFSRIRKAAAWPGVLGGLTPSISGTKILVGDGVAWGGGKSALGTQIAPVLPAQYPHLFACELDFTGLGADTYFVYLDGAEADEADALKAMTDAAWVSGYSPLAHLPLCKVAWNGTTTLSALADIRGFGVQAAPLIGYNPAALGTDTIIWRWEIDAPCAIRRPRLALQECGSGGGPTVITVNTGTPGSTAEIYSAPGDRFSIAHSVANGTQQVGIYPDQHLALVAGECVEVLTVGAPATGSAAGCSVVIPRFYYDVIA